MTEAEAKAEAAKRERHKSKHIEAHWTAAHDSVRGWHVKLIKPEPPAVPTDIADDMLANTLVGRDPIEAAHVLIALIGPDRARAAAERMINRLTARTIARTVDDATMKALTR